MGNTGNSATNGRVKGFALEAIHRKFFDVVPDRDVLLYEKPGAKARMRLYRHSSKTFWPASGMIPGAGCFIWGTENEFTAVAIDLQPLVKVGITPDTYEDYFGTVPVKIPLTSLIHKHARIVEMKPWDFLYIPPGFIWHVYTIERRPKTLRRNDSRHSRLSVTCLSTSQSRVSTLPPSTSSRIGTPHTWPQKPKQCSEIGRIILTPCFHKGLLTSCVFLCSK